MSRGLALMGYGVVLGLVAVLLLVSPYNWILGVIALAVFVYGVLRWT